MDFKQLLPDFSALSKTDWKSPLATKPNLKELGDLLLCLGTILMVVFLFVPWFKISQHGSSVTSGVFGSAWNIIGFILTIVALVGLLYDNAQLVFCAAALAAVCAVVSLLTYPSLTENGVTLNGDEVKTLVDTVKPEVSRLGAILFLISSAAAAVGAYLKIAGKKIIVVK